MEDLSALLNRLQLDFGWGAVLFVGVVLLVALLIWWYWQSAGGASSASVRDSGNSSSAGGSGGAGGHASGGSSSAIGNNLTVVVGGGAPHVDPPKPPPPLKTPVDPPRIRIDLEKFEKKQLKLTQERTPFSATVWFARFINRSDGILEKTHTAKEVRASVLYENSEDSFELHVDGFWIHDFADVVNELETGSYMSGVRSAWLKPGEREYLVLVLRTKTSPSTPPSTYAYDHKSTRNRYLRRDDLVIPVKRAVISIELRGPNVHEDYRAHLVSTDDDFRIVTP